MRHGFHVLMDMARLLLMENIQISLVDYHSGRAETCDVEIVNQLEQRFTLAQGNMFVNKISANKREQNRQIGALHFISEKHLTMSLLE